MAQCLLSRLLVVVGLDISPCVRIAWAHIVFIQGDCFYLRRIQNIDLENDAILVEQS